MATYKTPGVYVEEISTLPASVAQVATAIPAFIGYTEQADDNGTDLTNVPTRITSMIEYEKFFGGPQPETGMTMKVEWDKQGNRTIQLDPASTFSEYVMYYQMQMYFANGGGPCYIVSVGKYTSVQLPSADVFTNLKTGLDVIAAEDEPTLIIFPDAKGMESEGNFYNLYEAALAQCHKLMDRFTIIDVYDETSDLRNELSSDYLSYGAVYYPDLKTSLSYTYNEAAVTVKPLFGEEIIDDKISVRYNGPGSHSPSLAVTLDSGTNAQTPVFIYDAEAKSLEIKINNTNPTTIKDLLKAWKAHPEKGAFAIVPLSDKDKLDNAARAEATLSHGDIGEYVITDKISVRYEGVLTDTPELEIATDSANNPDVDKPAFSYDDQAKKLTITINENHPTTVKDLLAAWKAHPDKGAFTILGNGEENNLNHLDYTTPLLSADTGGFDTTTIGEDIIENKISVRYEGPASETPKVKVETSPAKSPAFNYTVTEQAENLLTITVNDTKPTPVKNLLATWDAYSKKSQFGIEEGQAPSDLVPGDAKRNAALNYDNAIPGVCTIPGKITVTYTGPSTDDPTLIIETSSDSNVSTPAFNVDPATHQLTITIDDTNLTTISDLTGAWTDQGGFSIAADGQNPSPLVPGDAKRNPGFIYTADHNVADKITVSYEGLATDAPRLTIATGENESPAFSYDDAKKKLTITINNANLTTVTDLLDAWDTYTERNKFSIIADSDKDNLIVPQNGIQASFNGANAYSDTTLEKLALINETQAYNEIKAEIAKHTPVLAPSAAMAGVYARTDRDRGVWKAPANTPVAKVIAPTLKISDADQENLNVDPNSGKSINAIRSFFGKGTLVWGARTLAGNDNEWRYVSTRRFYIMAEESIKKGTSWVVFEPNDANTWVKVKAQIENFLNGLWRDGALAGASPGEAFFVNVGLGITMDVQDILEGRMNIEIGMAVVRPAEFIILKFSHMLQKS